MSQCPSFARASIAALAAVALFAGCRPVSHDAAAEKKPGSPLSLTIATTGAVEPGEIGHFTVAATVLADGMLTLDVDLPEGLALYSGDLHQEGPARKDTEYRLTFSIRVPESGSRAITATARIQRPEGGFIAKETYVLGGGESKPVVTDPGLTKERNGEVVREYRVP
jgi:hypothetical protein